MISGSQVDAVSLTLAEVVQRDLSVVEARVVNAGVDLLGASVSRVGIANWLIGKGVGSDSSRVSLIVETILPVHNERVGSLDTA